MKLKYVVTNQYYNIKEVLRAEFNISERLLSRLKKENKIFLNSKVAYVNSPIKENDIIEVDLNFEENSDNIIPTKMDLNIIYEDDTLVAINKVPEIPVHPSITHYTDSLSNGVKFYFESKNLNIKIRPVNRLDKGTSGIVIFAKNSYIQECLIKQMNSKIFKKKYIGLVNGYFTPLNGTINAPIVRKENSIIERCVNLSSSKSSEQAITHYKTLKIYEKYSLVEFILETGRTHQIRVHSQFKGNPLIGDNLYGDTSNLLTHQALHAFEVNFIHPLSKQLINLNTDLPIDFQKLIEQ